MKLCIDCKHFKPTYGLCISPKNGESPVDGEPKSRLATIQRSDYTLLFTDLCGPGAVNFEEKPSPPSFFFDESPQPHVTTTVSSMGFLHTVYQFFGKQK